MSADFLTIIPNWLPGWLGAGAAAGGSFGVIKWAAEFIATRVDKRAAALDQDTRFIIESLRKEVDRLATRVADLEASNAQMREDLADCHRKHGDAEARVQGLLAQQQARGDERQRAQLIVAAELAEKRQQGNEA
jgi:hypothetical protein